MKIEIPFNEKDYYDVQPFFESRKLNEQERKKKEEYLNKLANLLDFKGDEKARL